jgi:hypothetical protein
MTPKPTRAQPDEALAAPASRLEAFDHQRAAKAAPQNRLRKTRNRAGASGRLELVSCEEGEASTATRSEQRSGPAAIALLTVAANRRARVKSNRRR